MNIAFLTRCDPKDVNNWSGTFYHMYHKLKERHRVYIIGTELLKQASLYQRGNFLENMLITPIFVN